MKAAVLYQQGLPFPFVESGPFRIEDVEITGPGEGEILVQIKAAGLCHSDLSAVKGIRPRHVPYVGGHEGAGVVVEIGHGVSELRPGDHVVMSAGAGCGHCMTCHSGRPVLCEQIRVARTEGVLPNHQIRLSRNGAPVYHYSAISSFAEYAVVTPENLIRIDPALPLDIAAMFGCAVVTGAGAIFNAASLRAGQSVAVFGLGGVGLNAVMAARVAGASHIIGIDINPAKFHLAKELGCTDTYEASDKYLIEKVKDLTRGGVDFAIEVSGSQDAMNKSFDITRLGAEIICVGVTTANKNFTYPHNKIVNDEKIIKGTHFGSGNPHYDIPKYLDLFTTGKLPVNRLKSATFGFHALNMGLDQLQNGDAVRQILQPDLGLR